MIVEEIAGWRDFLALAPAWRALADGDFDSALLGHDWTAQAWKCCRELRDGSRPLVLGVREDRDGDWRAMLALRHELHARRVCFLEEHRSQRLDVVAGCGDQTRVWNALGKYFRRRRDWDRLDLRLLREPSARALLTEWPRLGLAVRERGRVRQRRIRLNRNWDQVQADFKPYLRANFRRRQKRLLALGELALEIVTRPAQLQPCLDDCFRLEQNGWKGNTKTAILDLPERHRFYRQLAFRLGAQDRFRLFCLRLNQRLIAFEYCVASRRQLFSLKIAYDESLRTASPGMVLRWLMLQAVRQDFDAYDFLGDDAEWKADWTPEVTELVHLRAYNRTLRGQAWRWRSRAHAAYRRLRSGLKIED